ncbi:GMC family oxidoreductase [Parendozoicomonas haliclonae]|uniref:6'''-hydroxyparomomycin C oxidase n=1 Tax=Parendozoicomonas haliclonae TaxID=1960125 RepID=A0A1X7AL70_9GAMM|nr:GMC family oxidoreductase [Parendozoicomonas haliclonae]SMA48567.1 6'''-hydroxyparomomycin C oxidase [Parendozoicomonas haliclonae]
MAIKDLFAEGVASGWKVHNASRFTEDQTFETDVVIIGTGAGGGTTAEILSQAGLRVLMVEEGHLKSSNDFNMDERDAYSTLYQEAIGRQSKDGAITILQGRAVGGTTVINWTSSFRTPKPTLDFWESEFDVKGCSDAEMASWFEDREERLNVETWQVPPNPNNAVLQRGCEKLGHEWKQIPRNTKGCWNLGYCGTGCPTNAKQSMLVTTIPEALKKNAELLFLARANHLVHDGDTISGLVCHAMDSKCVEPTGKKIFVKAKHYVLSGGSINSPAVLLRSSAPDPYQLTGKRTFLHPVPMSLAIMPEKVDGYYGAPQTIYSNEFLWRDGVSGAMGYKLEVPPLQPKLAAALFRAKGQDLAHDMDDLPNANVMLALLRDGFHEQSQGGKVEIRNDGTPVLDYEITPYIWEGARHALLSMAEIQFAAGAKSVRPHHYGAPHYKSWKEAQTAIESLNLRPYDTLIGSAHVMGGCPMGENKERTLVNSLGEHHYLENLSVIDGSVFPTSIGANPQLSIYGQAVRMATHLKQRLGAPVISTT